MTIPEIVKDIKKNCLTGSYFACKPSDFFCGATNYVARRMREHHVDAFICNYTMKKKEYADELLKALQDEGFRVGDIGNGQDDSIYVYVYKRISGTTVDEVNRDFEITFDYHWYAEKELDNLPDHNGIYICVACDKKMNGDLFVSKRLVYIGMTKDQGFKKRIAQHKKEDYQNWEQYYDKNTEQLVYAIANFGEDTLQTVEAVLIYCNQPPANTEYRNHYQGEYHFARVKCKGYRSLYVALDNVAEFK